MYYYVDPDGIWPKKLALLKNTGGEFVCLSKSTTKWSFNDAKLPSNVKVRKERIEIVNALETNKGYYECKGAYDNKTFSARGILLVRGNEYTYLSTLL